MQKITLKNTLFNLFTNLVVAGVYLSSSILMTMDVVMPQSSKNEDAGFTTDTSDQKFTYAILPQFTSADNFVGGLARVKTSPDSKVGYIDRAGKFAIEAQFTHADNFSEGLAAVELQNRWGYIQPDGKLVIPAGFDRVQAFSESYAAVKIGGKWGFIDRQGKLAISPRFTDIAAFSEGIAAVEVTLSPLTLRCSGSF